jgi:RNA processing factor Prp31
MPDKTKETLKTFLLILGVISIFASPIIAMTLATQNGKEARAVANKALSIAEANARDFAFFKGEVNAKLDNLTKGQDRIIEFMSNIEKVD